MQAPISIELGKDRMNLTDSLVTLMKEMTPDDGPRVSNPGRVYAEICGKVERFKGFQQQDSHELLRALLDSLRGEELNVCLVDVLLYRRCITVQWICKLC